LARNVPGAQSGPCPHRHQLLSRGPARQSAQAGPWQDRLTITILSDTRTVDGVTTGVLEEREERDGQLIEVSRNFFATDRNTGDVYYFGEDVDNYKDGKIINHDSAWLAGEKGACFGLMMPGKPKVGRQILPGDRARVALDRVEIVSIDATVKRRRARSITAYTCAKPHPWSRCQPQVLRSRPRHDQGR